MDTVTYLKRFERDMRIRHLSPRTIITYLNYLKFYLGYFKNQPPENLSTEDIRCSGCLSDDVFMYCKRCEIKDCTKEKGYTGCHECDEFPCQHIENFPMAVGKKVILRAIPYWREVGTEKWIQDEEARYICPECGNKVFRGVVKCNQCKVKLDLD